MTARVQMTLMRGSHSENLPFIFAVSTNVKRKDVRRRNKSFAKNAKIRGVEILKSIPLQSFLGY